MGTRRQIHAPHHPSARVLLLLSASRRRPASAGAATTFQSTCMAHSIPQVASRTARLVSTAIHLSRCSLLTQDFPPGPAEAQPRPAAPSSQNSYCMPSLLYSPPPHHPSAHYQCISPPGLRQAFSKIVLIPPLLETRGHMSPCVQDVASATLPSSARIAVRPETRSLRRWYS